MSYNLHNFDGGTPCPCRSTVVMGTPSLQRGAALIVAMIILVILTMLGVSGLRTANLEEHFSGNLRDQNLAFEAAESALRYAEDWLAAQNIQPDAVVSCLSPPCDVFEASALEGGYFSEQSISWWATNGRSYVPPSGSSDLIHVSTQPHFIVEESGFSPDSLTSGASVPTGRQYYRVTAIGQGGSQYTNVVVRSTYAKRFN